MRIKTTMRASWNGIFDVAVVSAAALLGAAPAHAAVGSCGSSIRFDGPWIPKTLPANLVVGTPVASLGMTHDASFTVTGSDELITAARQVLPESGFVPAVNANNVGSVPGLGIRLTHRSTSLKAGSAQVVVPPGGMASAPGTSNERSRVSIGAGRYLLTQHWEFELVVTDVNSYRGIGAVSGFHVISAGLGFQSSLPTGSADSNCRVYIPGIQIFQGSGGGGGTSPPLPPGGGGPDLPKPPERPATCNFAPEILNQTVALRPAYRDNVAPSGSARSAGEVGEVAFNLVGTGCGSGVALKIFTMDAKNHANTTSNLTLSTGDINVHRMALRLYHGDGATPLSFGPTPTDNNLGAPNHVAITVPPAGGTVTVPFTAQYVLLPGFNATDLQPGPVSAAAFVTVIYP